MNDMEKLWEGRFQKKTDPFVEEFTASINFDNILIFEDILGSICHAKMLKKVNILTEQEEEKINKGLKQIANSTLKNKIKFDPKDEDIHMYIEKELGLLIGPLAGKLHTARSRNDQVSLDLHLYLRKKVIEIINLIVELQNSLINKANENIHIIMPGYTHLQRAEPIYFSFHLLAYISKLERDIDRLKSMWSRLNQCPLGACALVGTSLPIDRQMVADLLNFDSIYDNSMDAVSDRDFCIEFLSAASIFMNHLSSLSEELINWSSQEFNFIELDDAYCTGSSIMPQKKNPDIPELIRGKTGRIHGSLVSILILLKGLPLAYNKDLQEDKEPVFYTVDTVKNCTSIMAKMIKTLKVNSEIMFKATQSGFINATELSLFLSKRGIPFRKAHSIVGKIVSYCIENNKKLEELSLKELAHFSKEFELQNLDITKAEFEKEINSLLDLKQIVERKNSLGATSSTQINLQLNKAIENIKKTKKWSSKKKELIMEPQKFLEINFDF